MKFGVMTILAFGICIIGTAGAVNLSWGDDPEQGKSWILLTEGGLGYRFNTPDGYGSLPQSYFTADLGLLKHMNRYGAAGFSFYMDAEADNISFGLKARIRYRFLSAPGLLIDVSPGIFRPVESGHFDIDRWGYTLRTALSYRDRISIFGGVDLVPRREQDAIFCLCESKDNRSALWSAGIKLGSAAGLITALGVPAVLLAMIFSNPPS